MKSYKQFITESKKDINLICQEYEIKDYTINDGLIDVEGNVDLTDFKLILLPLKFGIVTGDFFCGHNKLTSLIGSPTNVGGNFDCYKNKLTSLEGCPKKIGGDFFCENNFLTTLEGYPEMIGGDFYCRDNKLKDFRGISEFFEGDFYCRDNPIEDIWNLFNDNRCIRLINEFDVIIDGSKIIMDRLEDVFHLLGMDIPENINLPSYEII
jgi:hypothetical protein